VPEDTDMPAAHEMIRRLASRFHGGVARVGVVELKSAPELG
jgi:hypothetical protein